MLNREVRDVAYYYVWVDRPGLLETVAGKGNLFVENGLVAIGFWIRTCG